MRYSNQPCDGFHVGRASRRDMLRAGSLATMGLGLPQLYAGRAVASSNLTSSTTSTAAGFGKAKSCIVIFQWGGPSQLDTWDPKPDAPAQIRGSFNSIDTKIPGIRISEHFPMLAERTDKLAIIRSMSHDDPAHLSSAHRVLTGHLAPSPYSDAAGPSPRDWPHLGSIVARLRPQTGALPPSVTMPWTVAHPAAPGGKAPGQHSGWLGKAYEPFHVTGDPNSRFFQVPGLGLPEGVDSVRMKGRKELLGEFPLDAWSGFQTKAINALESAEARGAFDLEKEDPRTRDRYGRHIHGQCLLMARKLVEAGVRLVTVNWHDDRQNFWDTHGDNFNHLKNRLMPPADRGFSALLDDLDQRGLLDETLIVWCGEFGRTPRTTNNGTGREHWPRCYSAALAGGGILGGSTYGASDKIAAYPSRDPVSPDDMGATILHSLGIDHTQEIPDAVGRPMRINNGRPVTGLFA